MTNIIESTVNGLYYRQWPAENSKAVVMLVHGLGEHCQRYEHLAAHLNGAGYSLSSMDLPCHGQSDGPRGHIDSFDEYQNAALELYKLTQENHP